MQVVFIDNLKVETIIGVHAWERAIKQTLIIDAKLHTDMSAAFVSDNVADVIDYQKVCHEMVQICQQTKAQLVEYLANQLMNHLFAHYPVNKVELKLTKPHAIKAAHGVGVHLLRDR